MLVMPISVIQAELHLRLLKLYKFDQPVHSLMLSHIDYCNALFYNVPEYLLHKLTKVLYAAVRFIFGLRGSALRMHMQPYMKRLHSLPVKFHIEFKIALLTASACIVVLLHI